VTFDLYEQMRMNPYAQTHNLAASQLGNALMQYQPPNNREVFESSGRRLLYDEGLVGFMEIVNDLTQWWTLKVAADNVDIMDL